MENQSDSHCHLTRWRSRDCKYFKIKRYLGIHFYFIHSLFRSVFRREKMDTWIMRRAFRVESKHQLFCRFGLCLGMDFSIAEICFFLIFVFARDQMTTPIKLLIFNRFFLLTFFPSLDVFLFISVAYHAVSLFSGQCLQIT